MERLGPSEMALILKICPRMNLTLLVKIFSKNLANFGPLRFWHVGLDTQTCVWGQSLHMAVIHMEQTDIN